MILIIDNYDSFTYNLVHIVASETDEYEVVRNDAITVEQVKEMSPAKILISPGPGRPEDAGITESVIRELGHQIPILGVCLGHQAIGHVFGAEVVHAPSLMHGKTSLIYHDEQSVYADVEQGFTATRYHSLVLEPESIPGDLLITSWTKDDVIMGVRHKLHPVEGIQFHPESILTTVGPKIVRNWLRHSNTKIKTTV
ncbi:MAG: anthranilate/aminodeoxychorismate synthase component II [Bacteroidetes bacterium]|jgi:anthranilate synthase component 2|nr:anthranilate/aminodeoxychorismate synthase component II [Bacteroidota bacterium]